MILAALALLAPPLALSSDHEPRFYVGYDQSLNSVKLIPNAALGDCDPCGGTENASRLFVGAKGTEELPAIVEAFYTSSSHQATYRRAGPSNTTVTTNLTNEYGNFGLLVKYLFEPIPSLLLTPGLGVGFFSVEAPGVELSGGGLMAHIAAEYSFTENFSVRAGYDWMDAEADIELGTNIYDDSITHSYAGLVLTF